MTLSSNFEHLPYYHCSIFLTIAAVFSAKGKMPIRTGPCFCNSKVINAEASRQELLTSQNLATTRSVNDIWNKENENISKLTLPKSGPIVHHPHIVCKRRQRSKSWYFVLEHRNNY
jgi:hypothetical protein